MAIHDAQTGVDLPQGGRWIKWAWAAPWTANRTSDWAISWTWFVDWGQGRHWIGEYKPVKICPNQCGLSGVYACSAFA